MIKTYREHSVQDHSIRVKDLPWQISLFLITLLLPVEASFYVGDFRFTAYRLFLLFLFTPCFLKIFNCQIGQILYTDWLLLCYSVWLVLALIINSDFSSGLKSGGILVLESFGSYLVARTYIKDDIGYAQFAKLLVLIIIGLSFCTFPETITGNNILRPQIEHIGSRLGFTRAFGPFDHPILYGMFCASAVSIALYVKRLRIFGKEKQLLRSAWVITATFMSLSSGALAAVVVQISLAAWNRLTRGMQSRWWLFFFILLFGYILIDLLSNRTPMKVILHRLTFSAETAYERLVIWEWGTKYNVSEHPWFGIGFADWVRPSWMHSASMDNFWLVNMVRYGLPSFVFLSGGIFLLLLEVKSATNCNEQTRLMRKAWSFSILGLIIAGCTVHFWNTLHVWFFFMLGSGAWMVHSGKT